MKLLLSLFAFCLIACSSYSGSYTYKVTPEMFHYHYRETSFGHFFMKAKGLLAGTNFSARYHQSQNYFDLSGRFAIGEVDYHSAGSGRMKHDPYHYYELRLTHGYPFKVTACTAITPYLGLGYRYLVNDGRGLMTSTGAHYAYFRSTKYIYMPLGIDLTYRLDCASRLVANLEFDFLAVGFQRSELFTATITNTQSSGYGLRASLGYKRDFDYCVAELKPFVRYWRIDDSDAVLNRVNGKFYAEPRNTTRELGVALSFIF